MRADDALKYAAAILRERLDWTTDEIGEAICDGDHDMQLDAIDDIGKDITSLASQFGDPATYSDGRKVKSGAWIEEGVYTSHVWHPVPGEEETQSHRGNLPSYDPDLPSPGIYEVTMYPATQDIHVRVVRTA